MLLPTEETPDDGFDCPDALTLAVKSIGGLARLLDRLDGPFSDELPSGFPVDVHWKYHGPSHRFPTSAIYATAAIALEYTVLAAGETVLHPRSIPAAPR